MKTISVGVVGCGGNSDFHLMVYRSMKDVRLAAVCDINHDLAREKAAKWSAGRVFEDYRSMLDLDLDLVDIITPTTSHAEIAKAALESGKNVLVEKPMALTSKECRDFYWSGTKRTPLKKEQIEMYDFGDMAIVEYMVPTFQGRETNQKNLFAYFARDNYRSYIHLSKIRFVSGEEGLFNQILTAVRLNESYNPTASDLLEFGNLSLFRKDFGGAISYYWRALNLDGHRKSLGRKGWIFLVDQLGMSYGLSGDYLKAKETYEWAISQEPEYPMFFYNLACAYAEMNEMDEALRNLRLAYKYKGKVLPGQKFPDPRSDSSFKKYRNNKIFMAELRKME